MTLGRPRRSRSLQRSRQRSRALPISAQPSWLLSSPCCVLFAPRPSLAGYRHQPSTAGQGRANRNWNAHCKARTALRSAAGTDGRPDADRPQRPARVLKLGSPVPATLRRSRRCPPASAAHPIRAETPCLDSMALVRPGCLLQIARGRDHAANGPPACFGLCWRQSTCGTPAEDALGDRCRVPTMRGSDLIVRAEGVPSVPADEPAGAGDLVIEMPLSGPERAHAGAIICGHHYRDASRSSRGDRHDWRIRPVHHSVRRVDAPNQAARPEVARHSHRRTGQARAGRSRARSRRSDS